MLELYRKELRGTAFKYFAYNFGQIQNVDAEGGGAIIFPALLMDVSASDHNYLNNRVLESLVTINFYVCTEMLSSTRDKDNTIESAINHLGRVESVNAIYDGMNKEIMMYKYGITGLTNVDPYFTFNYMDRKRTEMQPSSKAVKITKISFVTNLLDISRTAGKTFITGIPETLTHSGMTSSSWVFGMNTGGGDFSPEDFSPDFYFA